MSSTQHQKTAVLRNNKSRLIINDFVLYVHLGLSPEEKSTSQKVYVSIEIEFSSPPFGEVTDRVKDTLCYSEICETLKSYVKDKSFNLIEKMAKECLSVLCEKYPSVFVRFSVCKKKPPIEGIKGGVKYICEGGTV